MKTKVFPNPAIDVMHIIAGREIQSVAIQNVLGQQVRRIGDIMSGSVNIDVSDLAPGIYFITIDATDGNRVSERIIIR
jgi:hypothetical protein